jgi:hypothetical protein
VDDTDEEGASKMGLTDVSARKATLFQARFKVVSRCTLMDSDPSVVSWKTLVQKRDTIVDSCRQYRCHLLSRGENEGMQDGMRFCSLLLNSGRDLEGMDFHPFRHLWLQEYNLFCRTCWLIDCIGFFTPLNATVVSVANTNPLFPHTLPNLPPPIAQK